MFKVCENYTENYQNACIFSLNKIEFSLPYMYIQKATTEKQSALNKECL